MKKPLVRLFIAGVVLVASINSGQAHVVFEGSGDFTSGLLHPFVNLPHLLAVTAFGLLCGQHADDLLKIGLAALASGLALGAVATGFGYAPAGTGFIMALTLATGLFVMSGVQPPAWMALCLGLVMGSIIATESASETLAGPALLVSLLGAAMSVILLHLNIAIAAGALRRDWQTIGVRVLGSWISAIGVLYGALLLRN